MACNNLEFRIRVVNLTLLNPNLKRHCVDAVLLWGLWGFRRTAALGLEGSQVHGQLYISTDQCNEELAP